MEIISYPYEIIFVADPCTDNTLQAIQSIAETNPNVKLISMSRRFGQPLAILAGLDMCDGDCAVVMDVDFQNPPSLVPVMLKAWQDGFDVVLPRLRKRKGESLTRTIVAKLAYKVIDRFSDFPIPRDVSDFRLLDRRVINEIKNMKSVMDF